MVFTLPFRTENRALASPRSLKPVAPHIRAAALPTARDSMAPAAPEPWSPLLALDALANTGIEIATAAEATRTAPIMLADFIASSLQQIATLTGPILRSTPSESHGVDVPVVVPLCRRWVRLRRRMGVPGTHGRGQHVSPSARCGRARVRDRGDRAAICRVGVWARHLGDRCSTWCCTFGRVNECPRLADATRSPKRLESRLLSMLFVKNWVPTPSRCRTSLSWEHTPCWRKIAATGKGLKRSVGPWLR